MNRTHDYDNKTPTLLAINREGEPTILRYTDRLTTEEPQEEEKTAAELMKEVCVTYPEKEEIEKNIDTAEKTTLRDIAEEIEERLRRHVTLKTDDDYRTATLWIIAAHFYPIFDTFPIFYIGKTGHAHGGTTLLMTMLSMSPRPILCIVPSSASIYRLCDTCRATIGIDEVRRELSPAEIRSIQLLLDGGFQKGIKITRALPGTTPKVVAYYLYTPKIIVDPHGTIQSYSTLSRGIRIYIERDPKRRETKTLKRLAEENKDITQLLHALYLTRAREVEEATKTTYQKLAQHTNDGRTLQATLPLCTIQTLTGDTDYTPIIERATTKTIHDTYTELEKIILEKLPEEIHTSMRGEIYISLTELAAKTNREAKKMQLDTKRLTATQIEHILRTILPPGTIEKTETRGHRRVMILRRDFCKTEKECRQKLEKLKTT